MRIALLHSKSMHWILNSLYQILTRLLYSFAVTLDSSLEDSRMSLSADNISTVLPSLIFLVVAFILLIFLSLAFCYLYQVCCFASCKGRLCFERSKQCTYDPLGSSIFTSYDGKSLAWNSDALKEDILEGCLKSVHHFAAASFALILGKCFHRKRTLYEAKTIYRAPHFWFRCLVMCALIHLDLMLIKLVGSFWNVWPF